MFDALDNSDTSISVVAVEGLSKCLLLKKLSAENVHFQNFPFNL